ncbi:MAG: hypothetical protein ABH805_02525 [Candidatus Nealsonbacteria bacterium]
MFWFQFWQNKSRSVTGSFINACSWDFKYHKIDSYAKQIANAALSLFSKKGPKSQEVIIVATRTDLDIPNFVVREAVEEAIRILESCGEKIELERKRWAFLIRRKD